MSFYFNSFGCGTTWHATGLVGQLRGTHAETKLSTYSVELYQKLEEETGFGTGLLQLMSATLYLSDFGTSLQGGNQLEPLLLPGIKTGSLF